MKPTRFLIVALVLLGMVATASALTPANTEITNQATGTYKDANNNVMYDGENAFVTSNEVTTTVSQVAGVGLGSNQAQSMSALSSTLYDVTLTNSGNGTDFFTIGATGASDMDGTYSIEIFHDANNNGQLDGTEEDSEITQTSSLAYFEHPTLSDSYDLLIRVTDTKIGGAQAGEEHVVTLTATSNFPSASQTITLTTTVQAASVNGETTIIGDNEPAPGESIVYQSCFTNSGDTTAFDLVFVTQMPSNTTLNTSSVSINGGDAITIPSTGATYDIESRTLTLELGDLGFGTTDNVVCVRYTVILDSPLDANDPIEFPTDNPELTYDNEDGPGGTDYPAEHPDEIGFPSGGVVVDQTYAVVLAGTDVDEFTGDPSDSFEFDFSVTNNGNGTDNFDLDFATDDYVTWVIYADLNGNGVLDQEDIDNLAVDETGNIAGKVDGATVGGIAHFIAVGTIPAGTGDTATDATTFTATSQGLGTVSSSDSAATTCTAPVLTLVKTVEHGETPVEYGENDVNSAPPTTTLKYIVIITNSGSGIAKTVVVSDAIPANTTYVSGSLTIDDVAEDDDDTEVGEEVDRGYKAANSVIFDFDTMSESGGATDTHTLTFQVTID